MPTSGSGGNWNGGNSADNNHGRCTFSFGLNKKLE